MDKITTVSLADRVKLLIGKDSQYALAKFLNISRPAISRWYDGTSVMDDDTAVRCAFAVGLDPEHVLCWLQVERMEKRGNDNLSQYWRHIAEQIAA